MYICAYICASLSTVVRRDRHGGMLGRYREEWKETRVRCAEAESNRNPRGLTRATLSARTNRRTNTSRATPRTGRARLDARRRPRRV